MYRQLGEGRLSSGERIELGVVEAPDEAWAERVCRFLVHKGGDWNYHINQAVHSPLDELETRFYVATVDGEPISHVMISGAHGTAILGHVFTAPAWRQRGAYRQLMAAQMADLPRLGLQVLTLGTGFESHPYWIYHSFGFRSVAPGSGVMKWLATPDAEERYLAPAATTAKPLRWDHWAGLNLLSVRPVTEQDAVPRLPSLGLKGQQSAEGAFLTFMRRYSRLPEGQCRVLQSETGAVVGWLLLAPDPRWFNDAWLLDLGALPDFQEAVLRLGDGVALPDSPIYALTSPNPARAAWLRRLGLRQHTVLPLWLRIGDGRADVQLWLRE